MKAVVDASIALKRFLEDPADVTERCDGAASRGPVRETSRRGALMA
jgi:hypothetical protein